jgi:hypothetical protein
MDAVSILLIVAAAGVNFGWQPAGENSDGYEYIVQVEPELLDVLRSGEKVPIESNVPADVGPIRKVSIVVGRGDVPRDPLSGVQRTAFFAGQPGSTAERYSNAVPFSTASAYDRYSTLPASSQTGVSPPPSVFDRAQAAVTETGTAVRDGVEAGIQAANQQLSRTGDQVLDATRNASQEVGRQLQGFASDTGQQLQATSDSLRDATERTLGTVSNEMQQVTNPFAASNTQPVSRSPTQGNVSPPPGYSAAPINAANPQTGTALPMSDPTVSRGMTPTQTTNGWTSIGSGVAAPPLIIPQLDTAANRNAPQRIASGDGPGFPSSGTSSRDSIGGIPSNPSLQSSTNASASDEWATGWGPNSGTPQATIDRAGNTPSVGNTQRVSNLGPVPPVNRAAQDSQQAANSWVDPWSGTDPWAPTAQSGAAGTATQVAPNNAAATRDAAIEWQSGGNNASNLPHNQLPASNVASQTNMAAGAPSATQTGQQVTGGTQPAAAHTAEQPPWLPLLVVSLSLVGSLSANLFLGWSYLDARQKYRTLVRKTADTFRRAASAAAV